ncbi:hypothetical protein [Massilia sp. TSP1-1-2]|uniref:hypothetical protein n=1 Tax=unclassified Massilia TaxID=2609279 RepID=UPI003CE6D570
MFTQNSTRGVRRVRVVLAVSIGAMLAGCAAPPAPAVEASAPVVVAPFMAQVVGLQWLNPLQRRDYPVEWQLLWTLGLVQPNKTDTKPLPKKYASVQALNAIAKGKAGKTKLASYHQKYVRELTGQFHENYFSSSQYFYNAYSLQDKSTWRELAGIHVEYALPKSGLDAATAAAFTRDSITARFEIGNKFAPTLWTRATPPDVQVTLGGANAGFASLSAALAYLEAHPDQTVWVMNWDAPSFPPKEKQINENMVLLMLAGPAYKTERAPLAWLAYPATRKAGATWPATLAEATRNAGRRPADIGYVIHDAGNQSATSAPRRASLAAALGTVDFTKQAFDTPALLGEMGAGTALTNVALGIAYANHFGKQVLVAGTTAPDDTTAMLVSPPAVVRPIDANAPWHRARVGNLAFKPWWGLRHDAKPALQGFSN